MNMLAGTFNNVYLKAVMVSNDYFITFVFVIIQMHSLLYCTQSTMNDNLEQFSVNQQYTVEDLGKTNM